MAKPPPDEDAYLLCPGCTLPTRWDTFHIHINDSPHKLAFMCPDCRGIPDEVFPLYTRLEMLKKDPRRNNFEIFQTYVLMVEKIENHTCR